MTTTWLIVYAVLSGAPLVTPMPDPHTCDEVRKATIQVELNARTRAFGSPDTSAAIEKIKAGIACHTTGENNAS